MSAGASGRHVTGCPLLGHRRISTRRTHALITETTNTVAIPAAIQYNPAVEPAHRRPPPTRKRRAGADAIAPFAIADARDLAVPTRRIRTAESTAMASVAADATRTSNPRITGGCPGMRAQVDTTTMRTREAIAAPALELMLGMEMISRTLTDIATMSNPASAAAAPADATNKSFHCSVSTTFLPWRGRFRRDHDSAGVETPRAPGVRRIVAGGDVHV